MKALTIIQPYASLIVRGIKKIETRNWRTQHRGRILVHCSSKVVKNLDPFRQYLNGHELSLCRHIIGSVVITDVKPVEELMPTLSDEEKALGYYTAGMYGWVLEDPIIFDRPVYTLGQVGLWESYDQFS